MPNRNKNIEDIVAHFEVRTKSRADMKRLVSLLILLAKALIRIIKGPVLQTSIYSACGIDVFFELVQPPFHKHFGNICKFGQFVSLTTPSLFGSILHCAGWPFIS